MAKAFGNLSISTSSNLGVDDGRMPKATTRRNGNHHPNLWSDDFIQSLSSPYGDSSYSEHRDILINEIRDTFSNQEEFSLLERIWFVDVVQCLGIDWYFQEEIKMALDYIHKYWNENIIGDLNITALGFRILRLNRYDVSSDVFQKFKGEGGQFYGFESSHEDTKLASMLNLYKASELDFPKDKILEEAKFFTSTYLQEAIKEDGEIKEKKNPLLMEIEYILKYPWRCRVPRWETWNFIQIFRQQNHSDLLVNNIYKMPSTYSQKLLELAILDFNILQTQHQSELKLVSTWDVSNINNHPDYMKITFKFVYQIHKEIATEAKTKHGPFVHKYIQSCWKCYISAYMQEAEWMASNYTPSFDQYIVNGVISVGMRLLMIHSLILMNTPLSDKILEQLDIPSSKLQALVSLTTRLVDDIKDFEDEQARGETASSIECYMKDNHGSTREDALNYITTRIESCVKELNKEFLKPSDMPNYCKNVYFNAGMRGIFFLFKDVDGFTFSCHKEIRDAIMKILVEPITT